MAQWGLPTTFDSHNMPEGEFIGTTKEAAWGYMIKPGSPTWEANKIASDPDAGVYENQTPQTLYDISRPESSYF